MDIEGLNSGGLYEISLLFNEGADNSRHWDIGVEDQLVVDNITSEGAELIGVYSPENSFGYAGEFMAPADGVLNVVMQQDIPGGQAPRGLDNNPILQAVIVNEVGPGTPFQITEIIYNPGKAPSVDLIWNSRPGRLYAVWISADMQTWFELEDGLPPEGDTTSYTVFGFDAQDSRRFFQIRDMPNN